MDDIEPTHPIGRRERNKQRVKSRLYESALRLFTENGYEQTSVDEIAEAADVARGTFFNHFQRKEDLITAWGDDRRRHLRIGLSSSEVPQDEGLAATLRRCMAILASINAAEREVTRAMLTAWVKAGRPLNEAPYAAEIFAEAVESARRRGEVPDAVDPRRIGNLFRDAYLGTLYRWSQMEGELDLHAELCAITDIILHGILARFPAHRD